MAMKFLFPCLLSLFFFAACNQAPSNPTDASTSTQLNADTSAVTGDADIAAIANTVHGFYAWYEKFQLDTTRNIFFTDDTGKHLKLNTAKLEQYFSQIKASGFISDEFFVGEREMWKQCEAAWQQEPIDEVPSCLDADRFFCAQDWDIAVWTSSPVTTRFLGTDHVEATLTMTEGDFTHYQKLELKKVNSKWLITKIDCDMGLQ